MPRDDRSASGEGGPDDEASATGTESSAGELAVAVADAGTINGEISAATESVAAAVATAGDAEEDDDEAGGRPFGRMIESACACVCGEWFVSVLLLGDEAVGVLHVRTKVPITAGSIFSTASRAKCRGDFDANFAFSARETNKPLNEPHKPEDAAGAVALGSVVRCAIVHKVKRERELQQQSHSTFHHQGVNTTQLRKR